MYNADNVLPIISDFQNMLLAVIIHPQNINEFIKTFFKMKGLRLNNSLW